MGSAPVRNRVSTWVLLVLAGLVTGYGLLHQGLLPTPSAWAEAGGARPGGLGDTLGPVLAVLMGAAAGVLLAIGSGLGWWGRLLGDLSLQRLSWLPVLGLLGLAGLWFGSVRSSLVPIAALAAAVPAFTHTDRAIREVDGRFVDLAGTVGLGRGQLVRQVILPGAIPGVIGGVRLSLAIGWLVLTVGELAVIGAQVAPPLTAVTPSAALLVLVLYGVLWLLADAGLRVVKGRALAWAG